MSDSMQTPKSAPIPEGEPVLRAIAMPADTNPNGDIFGGWLLSQFDLAGANAATRRANGPVMTVAISELTFIRPIRVGKAGQ
jgi:acyl-CoA thioesterase YciA